MSLYKPLFKLGKVAATRGALDAAEKSGVNFLRFIGRHASGDFGTVCEEDRDENLLSIEKGFRILSSYEIEGYKFWIITEADRSSTTILLPEEY